ncbi:MAG: hypothetical protein A3F54_02180 [Candidatus Kerfeldbacteria bacterium RIFCSPHIGHO2_12_FULL_48_17]|uniref:Uncharacterized protein n=1 Tax=Candidatus Kerfeldbacteria bacterium RIFCSPHIGHO2_12_FULL_48_17 TaxID=1798542 RepID=A0A1G2AYB2_9BACT|nr:MAG: hypothetical protein A3F54_02180 [Candidatus Kerfeldbacteria bacterium RIFCSPHIGHO2_12_FULL_48_17]
MLFEKLSQTAKEDKTMARSKKSKKISFQSQKNITPTLAVRQTKISEPVSEQGTQWRYVTIGMTIAAFFILMPHLFCDSAPQEPLLLTEETCRNPLTYSALLESLEDINVPQSPGSVTKAEADLLFYALARQFQKLVAAMPDRTTCLKMAADMRDGKLVVDFFRRENDDTFVVLGQRDGKPLIAVNPVALAHLRGDEDKILQFIIAIQKFYGYTTFWKKNDEVVDRLLRTQMLTSQEDCDLFLQVRLNELKGLCEILRVVPYRSHIRNLYGDICNGTTHQQEIFVLYMDKKLYAQADCKILLDRDAPP